MMKVTNIPANLLSLPRPGWFDRIQQRVAYSWAKDEDLFTQFVAESQASGRSLQLWHELAALSERFSACYGYIGLLLQPVVYWHSHPADLSDYVVCDKHFTELKQLYVDAFETTCRLSSMALALEAIIFHGSLEIPTKKGQLTVWQYDSLPNVQKVAHLSRYPISDMFVPYMDTALRNGIGHNTARYDPASDKVVWTITRGGGHPKKYVGYTNFCLSVLELLSTLVHDQGYFFATHVRAKVMPC